MNKKLYFILFIILMIFLFSPIVQKQLSIFKIKPLYGATYYTPSPKLTWSSYKNNKYQYQLEKHISETFGFREPVIRLYNQYIYDCYKKTYNKEVKIGSKEMLYHATTVKDHYISRMDDFSSGEEDLKNKLNLDIQRFYKVQEILKEYGTNLFIIMTPGKDRIYPEYLPKNTYNKEKGFSAFDYYSQEFKKHNINHINITDWFKEIKDSVNYPLFPKTGMHWSNIAVAYAFDSIINYMENISDKNILNIQIGKQFPDKTKTPDNDLEKLLNLMWQIKPNQNYYADIKVIEDTTAIKPDLITIGDSYYWNISYTVPMKDIFKNSYYWYYNNTIYFDSEHHSTKEIDFLKEILNADFIMLSYSTTQIYDINHSFLSQALVHLCYDDDNIQKVIDNIKNSMNNDPKWKESLLEKAKKQERSIEKVMQEDAEYILYMYPEKYFTELNDNKIPVSRNPRIAEITDCKILSPEETEIQNIKKSMYADPEWLESLKKKAKKHNKTLESIIDEDARWVLEQKDK